MPTTPDLVDQIKYARLQKGIGLRQLCDDAKLRCGEDSLSRKLQGKQPLTTAEAQALADALGIELVWRRTPPAPPAPKNTPAASAA
jgi:transcriptional regulator with XRE-family HTH domain